MSEEEDKKMNEYGCWDLSLSLRPPIIHPRHFSADEENPKMHKPNNGLMMVPKIMGVEMRPAELVIDLEEEIVIASPNSTLSTASGKRLGGERGANSDEDDGGTTTAGGGRERKKLRLSKEQIMVLEQAFREHATPPTKQKLALAMQVNLRPRQVEVWFQNRRARTKLKQTEVDCEYLRRFCDTLSEENRKLQNELHDLRALKVSPDYPSTSLSMCIPASVFPSLLPPPP